jgi:NAD(P)-dependent dehydrogenase (short-subunit alcohol dehydrogenase family)
VRDLAGKIAVVTGGAAGIGEGVAMALAEAGMDIVVADIEAAKAENVAARLREHGRRAVGLAADVTKPESMRALAEQAFAAFGAVHVLCNNAGVLASGPMLDLTIEDWRWVFDVNVFGVLNGVYAFLPRMLAQGGEGHIVNTASMAAFSTGAGQSAYTASKHACRVITEALRAELAGKGIGVSGLFPGGVTTEIGASQRNRGAEYGPAREFKDVLAGLSEEQRAVLMSDFKSPIEVGRMVRQGIIDDEPWIFSHPNWLDRNLEGDRAREDEIAAAKWKWRAFENSAT